MSADRAVVAMCAGTSWYLWNFRRNVIRTFADNGWQIYVFAPEDESTERLCALPGVIWRDWSVSLQGANVLEEFGSLWRLFRGLGRDLPDVVLNNGIKADVYGGLACRALGIPYINNIAGLGTRMGRAGVGARALARLSAFACSGGTALLIQNDHDLAFLRSHGLSSRLPVHRTMGSGVDLDHFRETPMPAERGLRFCFVGRLQRDKGIFDFVEAARALHAERPETAFLVVGDTTHTNAGRVPDETLEAWRKEAPIELAGRQDNVRPSLARSHFLVMPSHGGEGMPKVILEAAACGRPVITSDVPGCRDAVVEGETGWLHRPADAADLLALMRDVANIPEQEVAQMGRAARRHAESRFSDAEISRLTLNLARSALST